MNKMCYANPTPSETADIKHRILACLGPASSDYLAAPEPKIFIGASEVLRGMQQYHQALSSASEPGADNDTLISLIDFFSTNLLVTLFDTITGLPVLIWDLGKYFPFAEDYLFKSAFLPFRVDAVSDEHELWERIQQVIALYSTELSSMLKADNPVFLIEKIVDNDYLGWCFAEHKIITVHNYKSFVPNEYDIIPPSAELISALGLHLHTQDWEIKTRHEAWTKRQQKLPDPSLAKLCPEYLNAIELINTSRICNLGGLGFEIELLENTIYQLEQFKNTPAASPLTDILTLVLDRINEQIDDFA